MTIKFDISSLYRRIVATAWQTAWKHKHLWLFGFFATFAGFGGIYEVLFRTQDQLINIMPAVDWMRSPFYLIPGAAMFKALVAFSPNPLFTVMIFLAVIALVSAVFIWVITISIGALIGSADVISRGSDADFAAGVRIGTAGFWRVFGINALAKITIACGLLLTGTHLFSLIRDGSYTSGGFFMLSFILFLALAIVASIVAVYASMHAVLNNTCFNASLARGWKTFKESWLVSLEMAAVLLIVNLLMAVLAVLVLLVMSVPAIFLFMLASAANSTTLLLSLMTAFAVMLLIVLVIYGSFMTTFQVTSWTLLWKELAEKRPRARLLRLSDWLAARCGKCKPS